MKSNLLFLFILLIPCLLLASKENRSDSIINAVQTIQYDYPDSGIHILRKAIEEHPSENDLIFANLNYQLAYLYYMKGDYPKSQGNYMLAYQLYDSLKEEKGKAKALGGRGLIYLGRELYRDAIVLFEKAAILNENINNTSSLCSNYLNMGICYYKLNETRKAFLNLHKALNLSVKNSDYVLKTMTFNHLGYAHLKAENYDSAQNYFEKVYEDKNTSQWEQAFATTGLAEVHFTKNNLEEAILKGEEGLKIAEKLRAKWDITQITKILSKSYEKNEQYSKALKYSNLHKVYSDSLLNEAKNREISTIELRQSRLENEKLLSEKKLIEANAKFHRYTNIALIVLAVFLIVLALFYRKYSLQKSKYYAQLSDLNKQIITHKNKIEEQNIGLNELNSAKTRLFSILAHDLRSPMISIQQVLELNQQEKLSEKDFRNLVTMLEKQVINVNFMLNDLLSWANTQMDGMNTHAIELNLVDIVDQSIKTIKFVSTEKQITILHNNQKNIKIFADLGHTKIIINNLLNNALKFTPTGGNIEVFYTENKDSFSIHIKDNGIGMDNKTRMSLLSNNEKRSYSRSGTKEEMGSGLGLLLVKQFANYNNAKLEIESQENKGTTFSISFPKLEHSELNQSA